MRKWKSFLALFLTVGLIVGNSGDDIITAYAGTMQGDTLEELSEQSAPLSEESLPLGYQEIPGQEAPGSIDHSGDWLETQETLPASFDPRNEAGYLPPIRNQNPYGTCWAHAAVACAEIGLIKNKGWDVNTTDLSETQLIYAHFNSPENDPLGLTKGDTTTSPYGPVTEENSSYLDIGGNASVAVYALAGGMGLERDEGAFAYSNVKNSCMNGLTDEQLFSGTVRLSGFYCINTADKEDIKNAVLKYGALSVSYYHDSAYYSSDRKSFYCYDVGMGTNHAVTLIGWDDNYAASNFGASPEGNGAWLIRNSWGLGYYDYFWLSYYDMSLSSQAMAFEFVAADSYDNNYHYDGNLGLGSCTESKAANVFTAKANEAGEQLTAISFSSEKVDQEYKVCVYRNLMDLSNPESGDLVSTISGKTTYEGIYTVTLQEPVYLAYGETYSIVLEGVSEMFSVGVERSFNYGWISGVAASEAGQSFYESHGSWYDYGVDNRGNYRIHAFTKNLAEGTLVSPTGITLDSEDVETCLGESLQLIATIHPSNAISCNREWQSSDEEIVKVDAVGRLTPVSLGEARITVALKGYSGIKASCKVRVTNRLREISVMLSGPCACGDTIEPRISLFPENADVTEGLIWSSSDETVATVSEEGVVTCHEVGVATITATAGDCSGSAELVVNRPQAVYPDYEYTGENAIRVFWEPAAGADYYKICLEPGDDFDYLNILENGTFYEVRDVTEYNFNNVELGYYYCILISVNEASGCESDVRSIPVQMVKLSKIEYELNGGENHPDNPQFVGDGKTVHLSDATKKGYTFEGWSLSEDYSDSGIITLTNWITGYGEDTIKVYAHWKPIQYRVFYCCDREEPVPSDKIWEYDKEDTLDSCPFQKDGKEFDCWNTKEDGSGDSYNDRALVKNLTDQKEGEVCLYAQWKLKSYGIQYHVNEGTMPQDVVDSFTVETENLALPVPTRDGYEFGGWYADEKFLGAKVDKISKGTDTDLIFYAKWIPVSYSIVYELNGGENNRLNPTAYTIEEEVVFEKAVREGFVFAGWYSDENLTQKVTGIKKGQKGEVTLYACWKEVLTIRETSLELTVGETYSLQVETGDPEAIIIWESENPKIVKVEKGMVTAIGGGETKISAKVGKDTVECAVKVIVPLAGIRLSEEKLLLQNKENVTLFVTGTPEDATSIIEEILWTITDETILTGVFEGKTMVLSPVHSGKTSVKVTVKTKEQNFETECEVEVDLVTEEPSENPEETILIPQQDEKLMPVQEKLILELQSNHKNDVCQVRVMNQDGDVFDAGLFTYATLNPDMISVNSKGEVLVKDSFTGKGTAKVIATLKADLSRSVTFMISITKDPQVNQITLEEKKGSNFREAEDVLIEYHPDRPVIYTYRAKGYDGNGRQLDASGLVWSVSDTKLAKLTKNNDQTVTVTVLKEGSFRVICRAKDDKKLVNSVKISAVTGTPVLMDTIVTLYQNSKANESSSFRMEGKNGTRLMPEQCSIISIRNGKSELSSSEMRGIRLKSNEDGTYCIVVEDQLKSQMKGTYTIGIRMAASGSDLSVLSGKTFTGEATLTMKVATVSLKVTAKPVEVPIYENKSQLQKQTLEFVSREPIEQVKVRKNQKNGFDKLFTVDKVTLPSGELQWSLRFIGSSTYQAASVTGELEITPAGYDPIIVKVKVNTPGKAPSMKAVCSSVLYNATGSYVDIQIIDSRTKEPMTGCNLIHSEWKNSDDFVELTMLNDGKIRLYLKAPLIKTGTLKGNLVLNKKGADKEDYWKQDVSVPVTIKVVSTLPKLQLKKSSFTLNRQTVQSSDETVLAIDREDVSLKKVSEWKLLEYDNTSKGYTKKTSAFLLEYVGGILQISMNPGRIPATGNYKLRISGVIEGMTDIYKDITVKVIDVAPTVTLKVTGNIDLVKRSATKSIVSVGIKNASGNLSQVTLDENAKEQGFYVNVCGKNQFEVRLKNSVSAKSGKVKLPVVLKMDNGLIVKTQVAVQLKQSVPKLTVKAQTISKSGNQKILTLNLQDAIQKDYCISRVVADKLPSGMELENSLGTIRITLSDDAIRQGKYTLKLKCYLAGAQAISGNPRGKAVIVSIPVQVVE